MTNNPEEPLADEDMATVPAGDPTLDLAEPSDSDGTDGGDSDGTDGGDSDGTDGGDSDATDA